MTMNEIITETKRPLFILIWYTGFRVDVHPEKLNRKFEYTIILRAMNRYARPQNWIVVWGFLLGFTMGKCVVRTACACFLLVLIGFRLLAANQKSVFVARRALTLRACLCVWMKTAGIRILIDEWTCGEGTSGRSWWHSFLLNLATLQGETAHNYKRKYWLLERSGGVSSAMVMKRNENKHSSDK